MIRWLRALALLLVAPSLAGALDPTRTLHDFHHTGWTVNEGAPGQVTALAQTRDGYLWLGTHTGLFRFDGVRFERFTPHVDEALISDGVSALYAPATGGLWVGFRYGGASFLDDGRLTSYTEANGFSTGSVFGFARQPDGTVWAATYQGLMAFDGKRWHWARGERGLPGKVARAPFVARDGTLWVADESTLHALAPGATRFEPIASGLAQVSQIAEAADGTLWIAESDGSLKALLRDGDGAWRVETRLARETAGLAFDRDGTLWLTSPGEGLRRLVATTPDPVPQAFREDDGLTADFAWPLLEDREGDLWVGTARGLDRFRRAHFVPAPLPDGAYDFALVAGEAGRVYVGTRNRPLVALTATGTTPIATPLSHAVSHAMRTPDGTRWFGGASGIWRQRGDAFEPFARLPDAAAGSAVQAMAMAADGALWVSLNVPGVFRYAGDRWTHIVDRPGLLARASPLVMLRDRTDRLWLGFSRNRITAVDGDAMRLYTGDDGLAVGNVTALVQGRERVWIGGESGLAWFDGTRFARVDAIDADDLKGISGLVERADGELWLNGSRGVIRIPRAEVATVTTTSRAHRVASERFDFLDGLPGVPAQFRPLPTAVEDDTGRLWFATTSGVVSLDPEHLVRNPVAPPVHVTALVGDDRDYPLGARIEMLPGTATVRISYTATSLSIPERVRFRHRLEGLDADWRDAGRRREAVYTNLDPGAYRFRVIAANDAGVWNDTGATLDFAVAPHYWQTTSFRVVVALLALAVLWASYRARMGRIATRIRAGLHERHLERERIARELHDTLLQSVQGLVLRFQAAADASADEATRRTLERALERADAVLAEGRDRVADLRATHELATDLPAAIAAIGNELATDHAASFDVVVRGMPRPLAPLVRDEVHRIAREALINAFRHAGARAIAVEIDHERREFRLAVRDDGRGIAPHVIEAGGRAGHWGLTGMKERALRIGATFSIASRDGLGTRVEVIVPARAAYPDAGRGVARFFGRTPGRG